MPCLHSLSRPYPFPAENLAKGSLIAFRIQCQSTGLESKAIYSTSRALLCSFTFCPPPLTLCPSWTGHFPQCNVWSPRRPLHNLWPGLHLSCVLNGYSTCQSRLSPKETSSLKFPGLVSSACCPFLSYKTHVPPPSSSQHGCGEERRGGSGGCQGHMLHAWSFRLRNLHLTLSPTEHIDPLVFPAFFQPLLHSNICLDPHFKCKVRVFLFCFVLTIIKCFVYFQVDSTS